MKIMNKLVSAFVAFSAAFSALSVFPAFADQLQSAEKELTDGAFTYELKDGLIHNCKVYRYHCLRDVPAIKNGVSITRNRRKRIRRLHSHFGS